MKRRIMTYFALFCLMPSLLAPSCAAGTNQPTASSAERLSGQSTGFTDVPADAWYAEAVTYCQEHGLMAGIGNQQFAPESSLTRAMLVSVLWRQEGSPVVNYLMDFSDVPEGRWYSEAIRWSASERLIVGYGDGRFGTNDPITQAHLNIILNKYTDQSVTEDIPGFTGGNIPVTRAQTAAVMWNLAQIQGKPTTGEGSKVLIAYFSATGNTRAVAETVAEVSGGDLFEIVPAQPYTSADLNYNTDCRANAEQNDPDARPEIANAVENIDQYDAVLIGYPIWWGKAPKIIHTFLETYDLSGKTVATFCTSGGSGHEDATIRVYEPDAVWLEGCRFSGTSQVESWINGLDLPKTAEEETNKMYVQVGDTVWTATLEDNPSVTAWKKLLANGSLTVDMHDYGGFEKVGSIGTSITQSDRQITTKPGDIILYQGSSVTIYYDENTWNFTLLGHLDNVSEAELRQVLKAGKENVQVTFSLEEPT